MLDFPLRPLKGYILTILFSTILINLLMSMPCRAKLLPTVHHIFFWMSIQFNTLKVITEFIEVIRVDYLIFCLPNFSFPGYKSLKRLRNLEILDLSFNRINNNIFSFLNALTSLTTLFLWNDYMKGSIRDMISVHNYVSIFDYCY